MLSAHLRDAFVHFEASTTFMIWPSVFEVYTEQTGYSLEAFRSIQNICIPGVIRRATLQGLETPHHPF
jgi:hypothetical protein